MSGRLQVYLALHFCIWLILVAYARKHYQVCGGGVRRRAGRCMLVRVASVIAVCARQECVYVVICSRITEWAQAGKDCASGIVKCRAACSPLRVLACCGSDFLRRVLAMCACVPRCGCTECEVAMEKPREQMLQDAVAEKVRSRAAFRRCERVAMAGRVARAHGHGTSSHMRSAVVRSRWMRRIVPPPLFSHRLLTKLDHPHATVKKNDIPYE